MTSSSPRTTSSWSARERRRRRHCDAPRSPWACGRCCSTAASSTSDPMSTHAFLRGGVLQLSRWGLLDEVIAAGTPPVRRSTFRYGDETAVITHRPSPGVDALVRPPPHDPRSTCSSARPPMPARTSATSMRVTDVIVRGERVAGRGAPTATGADPGAARAARHRSRRRRIDDRSGCGRPRIAGRAAPERDDLRLLVRPRDRRLRVDLPAERVLGDHPDERR